MITFVIPGPPVGKARARVINIKGRTMAFTPDKTVNYENLVKTIAYEAMMQSNIDITPEPLEMVITAYYDIPKSISKKKAQLMLDNSIRPTKKPDIDNIAKIVADSLNGIAYKDDTQIVTMRLYKFYADTPRVEVIIYKADRQAI